MLVKVQGLKGLRFKTVYLRWTPHPVIVTIRDNKDYIGVLLYSYYATMTVRGVLLNYNYPKFVGRRLRLGLMLTAAE